MKRLSIIAALLFAFFNSAITSASSGSVVINEIAWMGTVSDSNDEWIELFNNTGSGVSLDEWHLTALDGSPDIQLSGIVDEYYLLERTDDMAVSDIEADLIYSGALENSGEHMQLIDPLGNIIDEVPAWYAGNNTQKLSMERIASRSPGNDEKNWGDNDQQTSNGLGKKGQPIWGTPGQKNSLSIQLPPEDMEPPDDVSNLQSSIDGHDVTLTWSGSTSIDVAGYNIYLDGQFLTDVGLEKQYIHADLAGNETSVFRVSAYDYNGNENSGVNIEVRIENHEQTVFINEIAFRNGEESDFIELICLTCSESGVDISGYATNGKIISSGTLLHDVFIVEQELNDEEGHITLQNADNITIDELVYGSGASLDYNLLLSGIERCDGRKENISIGRIQDPVPERFLFNDTYALYFVPTRDQSNHLFNRNPEIHIDILEEIYEKVNETYVFEVRFGKPESCDPDGDALSYLWDFGDGMQIYDKRVEEYLYIAFGEYDFSLKAIDENSGSGSTQKHISFTNPQQIEMKINELDYKEDWVEIFCEYCGKDGLELSNFKLTKNENTTTYYRFPSSLKAHTGDYIVVRFRQETDAIRKEGNNQIFIDSKKTGLAENGKLNLMFYHFSEIKDSQEWQSQKLNTNYQSYIRTVSDEFVWTAEASPGYENTLVQPGEEKGNGDDNGSDNGNRNNNIYQFSDAVSINELLINPEGIDSESEFIELYNEGNVDVDLYGWSLDDVEDAGSSLYTIEEHVIIPSGEYLAWYAEDTKISLNNTNDCARLVDPSAKEIDKICYDSSKKSVSYSRDTNDVFAWSTILTPGDVNRFDEPDNNNIHTEQEGGAGSDGEKTNELKPAPKLYKVQVYKQKGIYIRGKTLPFHSGRIYISGYKTFSLPIESDEKGYFSMYLRRPLNKGKYDIELRIEDAGGNMYTALYPDHFTLDAIYKPYQKQAKGNVSGKAPVEKKNSNTNQTNNYKYRNMLNNEFLFRGKILAVNDQEQTFLLQTEKDFITLHYKNIPGLLSDMLFQNDRVVEIKAKKEKGEFMFLNITYPDSSNPTHRISSGLKYELLIGYSLLFAGLLYVIYWGMKVKQDREVPVEL